MEGQDLGIWAEIYLRQVTDDTEINYHFDYIATPLIKTTLRDILQRCCSAEGPTEQQKKEILLVARKSGYITRKTNEPLDFLSMYPDLSFPLIIEVMTASTSGSDTENRTDIRSAFRDAILKDSHFSPGINKRQVWGRMVTQFFAKTAIATNWGGKTIWIIQDQLLKNIERTTKLRTETVQDTGNDKIVLVVMHYHDDPNGIEAIALKKVIQGDAGIDFRGNKTFADILLPKNAPPKFELLKAMLRRPIGAHVRL